MGCRIRTLLCSSTEKSIFLSRMKFCHKIPTEKKIVHSRLLTCLLVTGSMGGVHVRGIAKNSFEKKKHKNAWKNILLPLSNFFPSGSMSLTSKMSSKSTPAIFFSQVRIFNKDFLGNAGLFSDKLMLNRVFLFCCCVIS